MNKTLRKFSVLILSGFLLAACGDDDAANETTNPVIEPEFPTEFSDKTVEQNKAELQDNGIELIEGLTTLKNSSGIQTSIAFSKHLEGSTLPENLEGGRVDNSNAINLIKALASLGQGPVKPGKVASSMRAFADDFESIEQSYNEFVGVYAYNKANDTWTYTKTGSKITFQFPSKETGTTNNAEYSIFDYKGTKIPGGIAGDDYAGDYPTALKIELKIDGTVKAAFDFATTYDSKGTPTAMTTSVKIDEYTFLYELKNTTTEATADFYLTKNSDVLFAMGGRGKGSFTVDGVETDGESAVATASGYFQIMNIKFSAQVDGTALNAALKASDTGEGDAAAWNTHFDLIAFYADSKKKIADSEFYYDRQDYEETYCYEDYLDLDGDGEYQWEEVCETYTWYDDETGIRLVFQDGTKADLETYTEVGFADLEDEFKEFIESIN